MGQRVKVCCPAAACPTGLRCALRGAVREYPLRDGGVGARLVRDLGCSAILGQRMDSPTFNAGHSALDPRGVEPATNPDRTPARVLARPDLSEPHATPVAGPARSAAALRADIETLVTEDDTPVDMPSEKQQRLLTEPL